MMPFAVLFIVLFVVALLVLWMMLDYQYIRMQSMLKQEYRVIDQLTNKVRTNGF
jgi:uncharacterized membrane protein YciS (DUF1049 family)